MLLAIKVKAWWERPGRTRLAAPKTTRTGTALAEVRLAEPGALEFGEPGDPLAVRSRHRDHGTADIRADQGQDGSNQKST